MGSAFVEISKAQMSGPTRGGCGEEGPQHFAQDWEITLIFPTVIPVSESHWE
jgi:hypothetical protein